MRARTLARRILRIGSKMREKDRECTWHDVAAYLQDRELQAVLAFQARTGAGSITDQTLCDPDLRSACATILFERSLLNG